MILFTAQNNTFYPSSFYSVYRNC